MSLKDTIHNDMTQALKNKQHVVVSILRFVLSGITNREIELHKQEQGLDDEEVLRIVSREVTRLREARDVYLELDRVADAMIEERELKALEKYIPEKISEEAVHGSQESQYGRK